LVSLGLVLLCWATSDKIRGLSRLNAQQPPHLWEAGLLDKHLRNRKAPGWIPPNPARRPLFPPTRGASMRGSATTNQRMV